MKKKQEPRLFVHVAAIRHRRRAEPLSKFTGCGVEPKTEQGNADPVPHNASTDLPALLLQTHQADVGPCTAVQEAVCQPAHYSSAHEDNPAPRRPFPTGNPGPEVGVGFEGTDTLVSGKRADAVSLGGGAGKPAGGVRERRGAGSNVGQLVEASEDWDARDFACVCPLIGCRGSDGGAATAPCDVLEVAAATAEGDGAVSEECNGYPAAGTEKGVRSGEGGLLEQRSKGTGEGVAVHYNGGGPKAGVGAAGGKAPDLPNLERKKPDLGPKLGTLQTAEVKVVYYSLVQVIANPPHVKVRVTQTVPAMKSPNLRLSMLIQLTVLISDILRIQAYPSL
jgi:hypothetical protein